MPWGEKVSLPGSGLSWGRGMGRRSLGEPGVDRMSILMDGRRVGALLLLKHPRAAWGSVQALGGGLRRAASKKNCIRQSRTGRDDFVQDYCSRRERLNSTLLKQKLGEFECWGELVEEYGRGGARGG